MPLSVFKKLFLDQHRRINYSKLAYSSLTFPIADVKDGIDGYKLSYGEKKCTCHGARGHFECIYIEVFLTKFTVKLIMFSNLDDAARNNNISSS